MSELMTQRYLIRKTDGEGSQFTVYDSVLKENIIEDVLTEEDAKTVAFLGNKQNALLKRIEELENTVPEKIVEWVVFMLRQAGESATTESVRECLELIIREKE